ncbi:Lipoprotein [Kosakonia sp. BK9b]|uniref:hypothetical protein n=1 Tax=Kosakonia sp. TaxID=1916651 RepID=UPI0028989203|nr:hypothetical protein [Kosakonia sp.]
MMKKMVILLPALLAGCTVSDAEMRQRYATHYAQPAEYVRVYQQKIQTMSVEELAVHGAEADKTRMGGQKRMKIGEYLYVEDVHPQGNRVVFDYSLTPDWFKQSSTAQLERQHKMQKDLIYRTCSLETVKLAQQKGLEEEHNYYAQYPQKIAFTLRTSRQICLQNGFPR